MFKSFLQLEKRRGPKKKKVFKKGKKDKKERGKRKREKKREKEKKKEKERQINLRSVKNVNFCKSNSFFGQFFNPVQALKEGIEKRKRKGVKEKDMGTSREELTKESKTITSKPWREGRINEKEKEKEKGKEKKKKKKKEKK